VKKKKKVIENIRSKSRKSGDQDGSRG